MQGPGPCPVLQKPTTQTKQKPSLGLRCFPVPSSWVEWPASFPTLPPHPGAYKPATDLVCRFSCFLPGLTLLRLPGLLAAPAPCQAGSCPRPFARLCLLLLLLQWLLLTLRSLLQALTSERDFLATLRSQPPDPLSSAAHPWSLPPWPGSFHDFLSLTPDAQFLGAGLWSAWCLCPPRAAWAQESLCGQELESVSKPAGVDLSPGSQTGTSGLSGEGHRLTPPRLPWAEGQVRAHRTPGLPTPGLSRLCRGHRPEPAVVA